MTVTTIRPSDIQSTQGTFTAVGGSSVRAVISDNSDASYSGMGLGGTYSWLVINFTTFALPAGAVVRKVTNVVRGQQASGPLGERLEFYRTGSGAHAPVSAIVGGITSYANQASDSAGAQVRTQADVDGYQMVVIAPGPAYGWNIHDVWADVDWLAAPAEPTVSAPAGTITTTNRPTATWTHNAPSAQAAYQLKVFTAAQYSAGGFNPATSPATYDTGIVAGAAASLDLPTLPTSTTYRVYVRTAQLTNGDLQWSTTYGFSEFTVNVVAVSVSLVATAVNAAGRIDLTATRTASPVWQTIEWQASYDGGASWGAVRGYGLVTAPAGTVATAVDYEAPNGILATYRVRGSYVVNGQTITGPWVTATATWADASPCHVWLKDPQHPTRNMHVEVAQMPELVRDRTVGVFRPIGATYPVVISDVLQAGTATIVIVTRDDAEADRLRAVAASAVLLLQTPLVAGWQWGSRYLAPGQLAEHKTTPTSLNGVRIFELAVVEVARPVDDGIG